jgi:hypothetical protein
MEGGVARLMNVNIKDANDGSFIHSGQLPEAPLEGHFIQIHDRYYQILALTWNMTPGFSYQKPYLIVEVIPYEEDSV